MALLIKRKPSKICPCCLKRFFQKSTDKYHQYWEKKKYCSPKCSRIKFPIEEYNQKKLEYILSNTKEIEKGCLEWQGKIGSNGYPYINYYAKYESIHRIIWKIIKGDIPKGIKICHTCDNTKCVNILHLFKGTQLDNMKDMVSKGRQAKGFDKPNCKLSKQDKDKIIQLVKQGIIHKDIAKQFNIDCSYVSYLARKNNIYRYNVI